MIRVQSEDFDIGDEIAIISNQKKNIGGICSFTGLVREFDLNNKIQTMTLEHYPGMTERSISVILEQAQTRWPVPWIRVVHRVGELLPNEQIVLVMTASAHRDAAFAAAEFIMDYLKTDAVLWKSERTRLGQTWLRSTAQDAARSDKWRHPDR